MNLDHKFARCSSSDYDTNHNKCVLFKDCCLLERLISLYIHNKLFNFCKTTPLNFSIYVMIYNRFVSSTDLSYLCLPPA